HLDVRIDQRNAALRDETREQRFLRGDLERSGFERGRQHLRGPLHLRSRRLRAGNSLLATRKSDRKPRLATKRHKNTKINPYPIRVDPWQVLRCTQAEPRVRLVWRERR